MKIESKTYDSRGELIRYSSRDMGLDSREPFLAAEHDVELIQLCSEAGLTLEEYGAYMVVVSQHQESD